MWFDGEANIVFALATPNVELAFGKVRTATVNGVRGPIFGAADYLASNGGRALQAMRLPGLAGFTPGPATAKSGSPDQVELAFARVDRVAGGGAAFQCECELRTRRHGAREVQKLGHLLDRLRR
jgi:hypothetical protein